MAPRDLRQAFAANLRRLRNAKGISQEDLAYEADVNRTYLSKLEKGVSYPGLEIIAKLAVSLWVKPAVLLLQPEKTEKRIPKHIPANPSASPCPDGLHYTRIHHPAPPPHPTQHI